MVACRANWPWSFLIRSIYRTRRVFRPLSFSFSRTPAASLSCSFIQQNAVPLEMKCREFINLYLSPKAFYTWMSIPNYIILELPIDKLLRVCACFRIFKRISLVLLFGSSIYLLTHLLSFKIEIRRDLFSHLNIICKIAYIYTYV